MQLLLLAVPVLLLQLGEQQFHALQTLQQFRVVRACRGLGASAGEWIWALELPQHRHCRRTDSVPAAGVCSTGSPSRDEPKSVAALMGSGAWNKPREVTQHVG